MTIADTLALIGAGYTKDEIAAMEAGEPIADAAQEPAPKTPEAPAAIQPETPQAPDNAELLAAIRALTTTLQKSNIRASAQPAAGGPGDTVEETRQKATDMLLNLCNT